MPSLNAPRSPRHRPRLLALDWLLALGAAGLIAACTAETPSDDGGDDSAGGGSDAAGGVGGSAPQTGGVPATGGAQTVGGTGGTSGAVGIGGTPAGGAN